MIDKSTLARLIRIIELAPENEFRNEVLLINACALLICSALMSA
jgi:hypothetical protein